MTACTQETIGVDGGRLGPIGRWVRARFVTFTFAATFLGVSLACTGVSAYVVFLVISASFSLSYEVGIWVSVIAGAVTTSAVGCAVLIVYDEVFLSKAYSGMTRAPLPDGPTKAPTTKCVLFCLAMCAVAGCGAQEVSVSDGFAAPLMTPSRRRAIEYWRDRAQQEADSQSNQSNAGARSLPSTSS